ncbi:hypothetical protein OHB12_06110 [Nocardia sp. NBC_01730]|uniref:hypothetical protein n=1 Tax=Nocardia sp. NBC_01730 TaxID=2975998 RepID=UPI002E14EE1E|nr:hypothetical protein OHB12_06110 [Nocardia sp. NBC_01730]
MQSTELRVAVGELDEDSPHRNIWQWGCRCGHCYLSNIECVDEFIGKFLLVVTGTLCRHRDLDDPLMCSECSMAALCCIERADMTGCLAMSMREQVETWVATVALWSCDHPGAAELFDDLGPSLLAAEYEYGIDADGEHWQEIREMIMMALTTFVMVNSSGPDADALTIAHLVLDAYLTVVQDYRPDDIIPVAPRTDNSTPKRVWPKRAELDIARRHGWDEPERITVERLVRTAAIEAHNEAGFIRNCLAAGLVLTGRKAKDGIGVCGYGASRPTDHGPGIGFAGSSLAPDLTLPKLRKAWSWYPESETSAIATWATLVDRDLLGPGAASEEAERPSQSQQVKVVYEEHGDRHRADKPDSGVADRANRMGPLDLGK